jgi:hypothetical protein
MLRGLNQLGAKRALERFLNSYLNSAVHKDFVPKRQSRLMQFADPNEYMLDIIAHEADTRLEQRRARLCFEPPLSGPTSAVAAGF